MDSYIADEDGIWEYPNIPNHRHGLRRRQNGSSPAETSYQLFSGRPSWHNS